MILSDQSPICVGEKNRVYVWKKAGKGWRPHLVARQKSRKFSIIVWGCICFHGVRTLCRVKGNLNSEKYIENLDTKPVIARHFPDGSNIF